MTDIPAASSIFQLPQINLISMELIHDGETVSKQKQFGKRVSYASSFHTDRMEISNNLKIMSFIYTNTSNKVRIKLKRTFMQH